MFNIFNKLKSKRQKAHDDLQRQVTEAFATITELKSDKTKFANELKRRTVKNINGVPVVAWSDLLISDIGMPLTIPVAKYYSIDKIICISDTAIADFEPAVMDTLLTHQYHVSQLDDRSMGWEESIYEADRRTMVDGKPLAKLLLNSMVDIKKIELVYAVTYGFSPFLLKRLHRLMHV